MPSGRPAVLGIKNYVKVHVVLSSRCTTVMVLTCFNVVRMSTWHYVRNSNANQSTSLMTKNLCYLSSDPDTINRGQHLPPTPNYPLESPVHSKQSLSTEL